MQEGNLQAAVAACQAMNRSFPQDAEGWHTSSRVALQLGGAPQALEFIERALVIRPDQFTWQTHHVRCLRAAGKPEQAVALLTQLSTQVADDFASASELALLAGELNQHRTAEKLFLLAIEHDPDNSRLHYNLAATRRFLGDLVGALESADRALELNPADHDAHYLRSSLGRWSTENNHVEALKAALPDVKGNAIGEAQLCYALAKELEDSREFDASFEWLQRGARVRRTSLAYTLSEDLEFISTLEKVYDHERLNAPGNGCLSNKPIFVLGLPRTGTTLVERILSACDNVTSIGESTMFTQLVASAAQQLNPSADATRADLVRATAQIPFSQLGEAYLHHARPPSGNASRFVDKFPQNTLNIGAIIRALPDAPIVLLERHPMDACYAMFKALFTDIYGFSYSLDELGHYFIAHQRLMRHWRDCLPDRIHVVRYEDLVNDTETQVRQLLDYCGLPWQQNSLDFQHNPHPSTTASASQVRQGIYTSSLGLWKRYARQLAPLEQIIRESGCLNDWPEPLPNENANDL